ncbi:hypothetical protein [Kineosporia succinea]|uniref:Uncharacterized protein n=1 Tax=Kineosporia succinea TaxID=84632 RepID=A0ABT9P5E8_9ACTN|nr:hypothetical protein [Kineosporia succinea]MDP9827919.1 hypothetical protein [Kineosporia succinea]
MAEMRPRAGSSENAQLVEEALARATIHLNLKDLPAATAAALEAVEADRDFQVFLPVSGLGRARITGHAFMPEGMAFYAPAHGLLVVSRQTWNDSILRMAIHRFAQDAADRITEAGWLPYNPAALSSTDPGNPGLREMLGDGDDQ